MTILLPTLAVVFAAVCVWLTVRLIARRERWAMGTLAALVGVPVLYIESVGPPCWIWPAHTRRDANRVSGKYVMIEEHVVT
jgi:hypothetical protein